MSQRDDITAEASARLRTRHGKDVLDVPAVDAYAIIAAELADMVREERAKNAK